MSKAEHKWIHKVHPHSARADTILQEIMNMLDECSASRDNGRWGCLGCEVRRGCDQLANIFISKSIGRRLRDIDLMIFSQRFLQIKGYLP